MSGVRFRPTFDRDQALRWCDQLLEIHRGVGLAHDLKANLATGEIPPEVYDRLAKWCHTPRHQYQAARTIAIKISRELFGKVVSGDDICASSASTPCYVDDHLSLEDLAYEARTGRQWYERYEDDA